MLNPAQTLLRSLTEMQLSHRVFTVVKSSNDQLRQRLRNLLLDSYIDFVNNSFFNSFMIPSISIALDEGSDTFILARHKEVMRSARALSHELRPRFLDGESMYRTMFRTSQLLAPSS